MDVYFIYGLYDEAEPHVIRYVGQAASIYARIRGHYRELQVYSDPVGAWKWSVLFFGRQICVRLLEVVYGTRRNALDREKWHIADQQAKYGRLTNCLYKLHIPAAHAQINLVHTLRGIVHGRMNRELRAVAGHIAHAIDSLAKDCPALVMCTPRDRFWLTLPHKRIIRFRNQFRNNEYRNVYSVD